tara:strand:+ start:163 stop:2016 length:1854 start_codon:yes stop_codon:yes gene_type:complete
MAQFINEFEEMLAASPDGRPQTINNTTIGELFKNRNPAETKSMSQSKINSATKFFETSGMLDMTPAEITADPVAFTKMMQGEGYQQLGKSQATKAQAFLSGILEDAGHGQSWPSRTLKTQLGREKALNTFDFEVTRAKVKEFPDDVFSKLKTSAARLQSKGDKEAAAQLLMHMFGGYRPEDLNGISIDDINFKTGVVENVEIKAAGATVSKSAIFSPPILDAIKMHIGNRKTGLLFESTQENSKRINNVFDEVFGKDYLTVSSPKGGKRQEPMRVKKLRNLNESILSGYDVSEQARKVVTLRAQSNVAEDYATSAARRRQIEKITAKNVALFSAGSESSSVAQFMSDVGVVSPSNRTATIAATKEVLEELGYENAVNPDFYNSLPESGEVIGGKIAGQVDPEVSASLNQKQIQANLKSADLDETDRLENRQRLEELRDQTSQDTKVKKQQKTVASGEDFIAKALKMAKPIAKVVLPPVGLAASMFASRETYASTREQLIELGIPDKLATAGAGIAGATEFLPVAPSDVVSVARSIPEQPSMMQSMQARGQQVQDIGDEFGNLDQQGQPTPSAPVNIPDPVPTQQGMLAAGGAKQRVNQARSAALAGEETSMSGSFLN